eukprot:TRINITY_DN2426_c0_g1_i1.p1 TRINITY_DN2426_c0_g1~~TRINITY_DN2426_c0_g1_i1.p1  ORF type:complete len:183 (-),score=14.61 TRINITY_DN2426_c0_g1_i1:265-813(-)
MGISVIVGWVVACIVSSCVHSSSAALCTNWKQESDCTSKNDGGCDCAWNSTTSRCYKTDKCSGMGILGGNTSTCPYSADDACMNEGNFEECRYYAAMCGSQMTVLESCPLQFTCPCPCGKSCDTGTCLEDGVTCAQPIKAPDCPERPDPFTSVAADAHMRSQTVMAVTASIAFLYVGGRFDL